MLHLHASQGYVQGYIVGLSLLHMCTSIFHIQFNLKLHCHNDSYLIEIKYFMYVSRLPLQFDVSISEGF